MTKKNYYLDNNVNELEVYLCRKTKEYCITFLVLLDRVEFVSYSRTEKRVYEQIMRWGEFHTKFEKCDLPLENAYSSLYNHQLRHGASVRAIELLTTIDPARKKEQQTMATKKTTPKNVPTASKKKVSATDTSDVPTKRGRKPSIDMGAKIKLITKENPKREGSASHTRYELYRTSKTVQEYINAGGTLPDLKWDSEKGHIEIV